MSKKIGKESIYVDGRTVSKVSTPGDLTYDTEVDQLRSDLNCSWTDTGLLHGEFGLVAQSFTDADDYAKQIEDKVASVFSYGPSPEQGHNLVVKKFLAEPLVQGVNDKVKMGDMATVTPLLLRMKYTQENVDYTKNVWKKEPGQIVGPSPIGYRTFFSFPKEMVHQHELQFNHYHSGFHLGVDVNPVPDFLRFVQVVHGPSLTEEVQNYGEKVGLEPTFYGKPEIFEGASAAEMQEIFAQNMSDYYYNVAGTRIEDNPVVNPDRVFYDHSFGCTHMVSSVENKMIFKGHASGVEYNLSSDYNYYLPQYEQLLLNPENVLPPHALPDIYRFFDSKVVNKFPKKEEKEKLESFESRIINSLKKSLAGGPEVFAEESQFTNVILSPKDIETMKEYNSYAYMFPMHAKLRINIGDSGPITKILFESDLEEVFLRKTAGTYSSSPDSPAPDGFFKQNFSCWGKNN